MTLPKSKSTLMMFAALMTVGCPLNQCVDKTAVTMMNYLPVPPSQGHAAPINVWVAEAMSNGPLSNFLLTNFSTPGADAVNILTNVHAGGITAYYGAGATQGLYLWSGNTVYFLNDQTGVVNASIAVCPSGSSVLDFVVGGTGAAGYATCSGNPALYTVTLANQQVSTTPLSAGTSPNKLAVSADAGVFITDAVQPILYLVGSKITTITTGLSGGAGKPAIIPDGTQLWVPFPGSNSVAVVNISSGTVAVAFTIFNFFVYPREIVFSPKSTTAYILNSPSASSGVRGSIMPVDTGTIGVGEAISVGNNPAGLFISPGGDLLFVANSGDGTVSTVQTNGAAPTLTTDVGMMPIGVVANHNPAP